MVIYDLEKDVKYTLTQKWDRSPDGMTFSKDDKILYLTVGDHAKVKVFALPVPPTPSSSTTHPDLDKKYTSPIALTRTGSASGIQLLHDGSVVFTKGSLTSPNDVFIIRDLKSFEESVLKGDQPEFRGKVEQITRFTEEKLKDKHLSPGEEFWFEGAEGKKVQGWTLKPPGFKEGEKKKWPVLLLIHGGMHLLIFTHIRQGTDRALQALRVLGKMDGAADGTRMVITPSCYFLPASDSYIGSVRKPRLLRCCYEPLRVDHLRARSVRSSAAMN